MRGWLGDVGMSPVCDCELTKCVINGSDRSSEVSQNMRVDWCIVESILLTLFSVLLFNHWLRSLGSHDQLLMRPDVQEKVDEEALETKGAEFAEWLFQQLSIC